MQEVGSARKTQRGLVVFSSWSAAGLLTCPHVSPVQQSRDTLLSRSEVPRTKPRCLGFGFFQLVLTSSQLHRVNRLLTWIRPSWGQWAQRLAEKFFFYCRGLEMGAVLWMFQFSSVVQPCPTLCNHVDRSTPGLPVHHQLLELAQTHVHGVGDAIQPSHPLLSASPAFKHSQHQGLSKWVSSSHQVAKVLDVCVPPNSYTKF